MKISKTKKGDKYWIDKKTGIVVRDIVMDNVNDYNYEINTVVDEDNIKPEY